MLQQDKSNDRHGKNSEGEETPIYLTDNSTLQTPEEDRHDKSIDPPKDERPDVSNDDLHETNADRSAANDRPGLTETNP